MSDHHPPAPKRNLTELQKAWAEAYLDCGNATLAAQKAGYRGEMESLRQIGWKNSRHAGVMEYLGDLCRLRVMREEELEARLSLLARGSVEAVLDGDLQKIDLVRARDLGALSLVREYSTELDPEGRVKAARVKLHNPLDALEKIAQILGSYKPKTLKVEHNFSAEDVAQKAAALEAAHSGEREEEE